MSLLSRLKSLLGNGSSTKSQQSASGPEQAVIVRIPGGEPIGFEDKASLEDELIAAINGASAGEFDGSEVGLDDGEIVLYMYGPDADALFEAIRPVLNGRVPSGSTATVRYGDPGSTESLVQLADS